jgi:hypothetical protein
LSRKKCGRGFERDFIVESQHKIHDPTTESAGLEPPAEMK